MATGNITRLEGVWPETHERAVRDSAGVNLETKLGNINSNISQLSQELYAKDYVDLTQYTAEKTYPNGSGNWTTTSGVTRAKFIPVLPGEKYIISAEKTTLYGVLKTYAPVSGQSADFATGYTVPVELEGGTSVTITIPSDGYYFFIYTYRSNSIGDTGVTIAKADFVTDKIEEIDASAKNANAKADGNEFAVFNEGKLSAKFVKNEYINNSDGTAVSYDGWTRTDYINVRPFTKIKVTATHASSYGAVYNANKQRLARFSLVNGDAILNVTGDIHYLRVSDAASYMQNISFEILGYKVDEAVESVELVNEVFGKVTQLSPAVGQSGKYINDDGSVGSANHYMISAPIFVKKGQKITIHSYIFKNGCGLAVTDENETSYTPVIINQSTAAVLTKDYVAPQDCYVVWSYIDSQTHEIFISAAVDIYSIYEGVEPQDKTGILDFNPSVEFTPKFIAGKKKTNNVEPLVLLAFSDIHSEALKNLPRILQFHTEHASRIDEILNLGDMVSNQYSNDFVFEQVEGAENVLSIIGNHDTASYSGGVYDWTAHAGIDAYNKFIAPFVSNWGVTQPLNAATNGYCYYYKDYSTQGIRLVFLDVMGYDSTEEAWLTSVLADANTQSLSVLIVAHYAGAKVTGYDCKYSLLLNNYVNRQVYNPAFYTSVNVVESFVNGGGKLIGWLTGHLHSDLIGKLDETNQVCLVVDTAQFGQYSDSAEYDKIEGTPTQDAFVIVSIDTQAKTLSAFKVGCRRDKWQRTRDSVCVNYETATILCEN